MARSARGWVVEMVGRECVGQDCYSYLKDTGGLKHLTFLIVLLEHIVNMCTGRFFIRPCAFGVTSAKRFHN